jgi:hypothetical protein
LRLFPKDCARSTVKYAKSGAKTPSGFVRV